MDINGLHEMFKPEPLVAELREYLRESAGLGSIMHHPLVVSVCIPPYFGQINRLYEQKKQQVEAALAEKNWCRYIALHERPYRTDALLRCVAEGLQNNVAEYGAALKQVWTDSENLYQSYDDWYYLWNSTDTSAVMSEREVVALKRMPEYVTVYRGVCFEAAANGFSWTTSLKRARWFANRFADDCDRRPLVYRGTVARSSVWAYLTERNENEIVVNPAAIDQIRLCKPRS